METPLRKAREQRGLTLQEVAKEVDTDQGNLSRIERGEQTPSKELAAALSAFFGHEVSEMQILYPERYTPQLGDK
jgi:transcriptional regulator with XRE-family HTH domain